MSYDEMDDAWRASRFPPAVGRPPENDPLDMIRTAVDGFNAGLHTINPRNRLVERLEDVGLDAQADALANAKATLNYETGAARGEHLCNAFNLAAGVPVKRLLEIDRDRRAKAHGLVAEVSLSIGDMTQQALAKLAVAEGRVAGYSEPRRIFG